MANRSRKRQSISTRVTNVDPWVIGGEGRLRDLFPLPPWMIITIRLITYCVKNWKGSLLFAAILGTYIYTESFFLALVVFIVIPLTFTIFGIYRTAKRNPQLALTNNNTNNKAEK